jgi:CRP-like cAMP-binding protein
MQVLTESELTILDIARMRRLAAEEIEVSAAISTHLAMRVRDAYRLIAVRSLGNIRERVAYDLLDRAAQSQLVVGRLEVRATQADLADSIGSSREVMSRALRDLREEGIVETAPGVIRVVNPADLAAIVRAFVI